MKTDPERSNRIRNALWGLFIGDALAMPAHWYYDLDLLRRDFAGGIRGYLPPPHPHPDSFLIGSFYRPDVATASRLQRPYDILHEHASYYLTSYAETGIVPGQARSVHGNRLAADHERIHYHHGLRAGENTLGAQLVRVLLRSVIAAGRYDPLLFLDHFIEHLATPGRNRDPYLEIYLREWFENFSRGLPPELCAASQRQRWSIGSHGGLVRPLVIALLGRHRVQGLGLAQEHAALTHRSEIVAASLGLLVPLFYELLRGAMPLAAIRAAARCLHLPKISGRELKQIYRDHQGPGKIPPEQMWQLHMDWELHHHDPEELLAMPDDEVVDGRLSIACYPEHGLPLLCYLALREQADLERALLANANAGGDNVHRGMILGLLLGAASPEIPWHLAQGLIEHRQICEEIEGFVEVINMEERII